MSKAGKRAKVILFGYITCNVSAQMSCLRITSIIHGPRNPEWIMSSRQLTKSSLPLGRGCRLWPFPTCASICGDSAIHVVRLVFLILLPLPWFLIYITLGNVLATSIARQENVSHSSAGRFPTCRDGRRRHCRGSAVHPGSFPIARLQVCSIYYSKFTLTQIKRGRHMCASRPQLAATSFPTCSSLRSPRAAANSPSSFRYVSHCL